jgi:hypothetical protein
MINALRVRKCDGKLVVEVECVDGWRDVSQHINVATIFDNTAIRFSAEEMASAPRSQFQ